MNEALGMLADAINDLGVGLFLGATAVAIAWHRIARMRHRHPLTEIEALEKMRADGTVSEKTYTKLHRELVQRF